MSPYKHPNTPCSHSGGGVEFCHDYGLVFFISVHVHLLLASGEKKRAIFFEFRTIIPLENHCFGDRPFLPFEVGCARANAPVSLAWLKLTTCFGCGSAVNEPIFAVLNQLANLNGLKGQLINLASTLRRTGPRCGYSVFVYMSLSFSYHHHGRFHTLF